MLTTPLGRRAGASPLVLAGALAAALVVSMAVAVSQGAATVPLGDVRRLLWAALTGGTLAREDASTYSILWDLRVPRVLLAALVGAGLAIAGVACQALVRNPLADPFILGISSGASVGASLVVTTGFAAGLGLAGTAGAAFATAVLASLLVYLLSRTPDGALSPVRLVLTGVVLAFAFQGLAGAVVFFDPVGDAARSVMFWLLGGLGGAQWSVLPLVAATVALCGAIIGRLAGVLDVLAQGDEAAASLGLDPHRARRVLFLVIVAMTSVLVATAGTVGFVGLVVPHAVRMIVGPAHRAVLLVAPVVGALLLVWVDLLSRLVVAPRELPLGIVTALVGVPVFIVLLRRRGGLLGGGV
ncbi:FecCD family ABC transporter permease [Tsukamurella paurometabola]|nr:iron ABC transporter permease [Tsukamurella paurometabola]